MPRKPILLLSILALLLCLIIGGYFYATNTPEYLASDASRIPKFFGISPKSIGATNPDFCIDRMFSQGRTFYDFGSAGYTLNIPLKDASFPEELSQHPHATISDSTLVISVRRGDIIGTLSLNSESGACYATYEQVY